MDPLSLTMLIGAGASLLSGFLGSNAAKSASQTQAAATDKATALQAATIAQSRADAAPWLAAGKTALGSLMGELGLSKTNADGTPFQSQFAQTPGYQFQVEQGNKGVVNNLKALGLGASGAALKALTRFNQGLANSTYQQYLDRLSGVSTGGQSTSSSTGNQAIAGAQMVGSGIADAGAARASGYVGSANAITNALGSFANTAGRALGNYNQNYNFVGA
jgi:hypothetical protein